MTRSKVPFKDTYGVFEHRDSPLSEKTYIEPEDLWDKPLILSRQEYKESRLQGWLKREKEQLNIVATYNLLFNGSLMVKGGVGYALCLDKIIHTSDDSELCFRPLFPKVEHGMHHHLEKIPGAFQGYPKVPAEAAGGEDRRFKNRAKAPLPGSLVPDGLAQYSVYAILKYV